MAGKLSFSIAINLLTENFKKGTNQVKAGFKAMQMQVVTFAAALGAGGIGLSNLVSRFVDVARETNRVSTALKNVSGSMSQYADNQRFLVDMAKKYGLEINALTGNFAKFTASASVSNMSMEEQRKVFESVSRAVTAFGMSAEDSNGVFLALSQMMSKGKISSEELRLQMGERLPIALQAMAKAAGTSVAGLDKLLKEGKLMSADVLPKFADALNEMIPNVDTNNLETSVNRLKNIFTELVNSMDVQGKYKSLVDWLAGALDSLKGKISGIFTFIIGIISGKLLLSVTKYFTQFWKLIDTTISKNTVAQEQMKKATEARVAAELAYQETLADNKKIVDGRRLASHRQLAAAERALNNAKLAEKKANDIAEAASANAAAVQTSNSWAKSLKSIKLGFVQLWRTITGLFKSFLPIAIISGISALISYLVEARKEATRIKNIFADYKKEVAGALSSTSAEVAQLRVLQGLYNKAAGNKKLQEQYQKRIEGIVGQQITKEQNINDIIAKRIKLLEATATADFYTQKKIEAQDKINQLSPKARLEGISQGNFDYLMQNMALYNETGNKEALQRAINTYAEHIRRTGQSFVGGYEKTLKEVAGYWQIARDASARIENAVKKTAENVAPSGDGELPKQTELQKEQERYAQSLRELNARRKVEMMTLDEYNKAYAELNKKALISALSSEDKTVSGGNYAKDLAEKYREAMLAVTAATTQEILDEMQQAISKEDIRAEEAPILGRRDTTFDYKKSDVDKLREDLDIWDEYKRKLQDAVNSGASYLQGTLNNAMKNVTSLEDALKIAQVKQDVKDFTKELNEGLYSGIKDVASSSDRVVSAFENLRDVMNDVDATAWEQIMAIWNAMTNTVDSILSVIHTVESIARISEKLSGAKEQDSPEGQATKIVAAKAAEVAANEIATESEIQASRRKTESAAAEMAAKSTAAYAGIPFAGAGLAAAQIAAMTAMIQTAASMVPKFAQGGIVTGGSTSGDKILARVNSGEMILNQRQQSNLFRAINSGNIGGAKSLSSTVTTKVRAKDLILAINNELKSQGKKTIS